MGVYLWKGNKRIAEASAKVSEIMTIDPETVDIRLALNVDLIGEYPVKMRCPMTERHKDKGPSLHVYPSNVHCYGCQFHIARRYEALAFVLGLWDGRGDGFQAAMKAKNVAHKYVRTKSDVKVAPTVKGPISQGIDKGYHKNLMSARRRDRMTSYLIGSRGLSLEWIEKMKIGHDSTRFSIPVYDATGKLVTMRFRRDDAYSDASNKYDGVAGHNQPYLYPLNLIKQYADEKGEEIALWVVEGEFDAIRVWQDGYPAVTVTNGSGQLHLIVSLLEQAGIRVRKLYIITDQDEAGQRGAVKLSVAAEDAGIEWTRGVWDKELGKDYSDFRNAGGDMKEIRFGRRWCNVRRNNAKGQAVEDDCIL